MAVLFKQMTICGVGLIGGSLALIARREGLVERIVGLGRTQKNLDVALERGIIDDATRDPAAAARGADLVVLATPIRTMPADAGRDGAASAARRGDHRRRQRQGVGGARLEPLLGPQMALVAAHPVAGKETTGAGAADEEPVRRPARDYHAVGAQHARGDRRGSRRCGARPARAWSG